MNAHHKDLDRSSQFTSDMQLAMHRLMHLYELIQRPFVEGFDYKKPFLKEFQTKSEKIGGKAVLIWEDLDDKQIEKWIDRWRFVKNEGYEAFFSDEDKGYYPKFYKYRYKPMEDDFKLFLKGQKSAHKGLFHTEEKRDAFWEWFLSTYLRENIYPRI